MTEDNTDELQHSIDAEEEQALKAQALSIWDEHAKCEESLPSVLFKLCKALHSPGKKGEGFDAWLKENGKSRSTAYRWIGQYCDKNNEQRPWPEKQKAKPSTLSHVAQGGATASMKLKDVEGVLFKFLQEVEQDSRSAMAEKLSGWMNGQFVKKSDFSISTSAPQLLKLLNGFSFDGETLVSSEGQNFNYFADTPIVIAQVKAGALTAVLNAAARFAAEEPGYKYLWDGVHLSIGTHSLCGHSGDGRGAFDIVVQDSGPHQPAELFIPNRYLSAVRNIGSLGSDTVMIATTSKDIVFSCPPRMVGFMKPVGPMHPGVDSFPCGIEAFVVDTTSLRKSLLKARKTEHRVTLTSGGLTLSVTALAPEAGGNFKDELPAKITNEQSFKLLTDDLLKFLNGASGELRVLKIQSPKVKQVLVRFESEGRRFVTAQITPSTYENIQLVPAN